MNKDARLIGRGCLNWNRNERISDRYGTVFLTVAPDSSEPAKLWIPKGNGRIVAEVIEPHESNHIGDLLRGLGPRTPGVGQRLVLGEGEAFSEKQDGVIVVGVRPRKPRDYDWLDPRALYDCHTSKVNLIWEPQQ